MKVNFQSMFEENLFMRAVGCLFAFRLNSVECRAVAHICLVNESPLMHLKHDRHCHAFIHSSDQQTSARSRRLLESWRRPRAARQMLTYKKMDPITNEITKAEIVGGRKPGSENNESKCRCCKFLCREMKAKITNG